MNNYKYEYCEDVYYWSFYDLIRGLNGQHNDVSSCLKPTFVRDGFGWQTNLNQKITSIIDDPLTLELWYDYLAPTYLDECVAITNKFYDIEHEYDTNAYNEIFGSFWRHFEQTLVSTFDRYALLLNTYKENKDKLMNQVSSTTTSKSRINEIPQASNVDPYDTAFTNHSTTGDVTTASDVGTVAQRLAEIDNLRYNKFIEWSKEFSHLFITI